MLLNELEIHNICECKHALLKFPSSTHKSPLYLVQSSQKCEVITLALQLICGAKYSRFSALHEIRDKIFNGKVRIIFTLMKSSTVENDAHNSELQSHSSDSDVPCTSSQARQRLQRRLERRRQHEMQQRQVVINACRNFSQNPDLIVYSVDNGPLMECSVLIFQIRFFPCTDVIFPRVANISHGEYCKGRWLDLLSMEFVDKGREGNHLLTEFCHLFAQEKFSQTDNICKLTTSVLTARNYLNNSRLSHLINIFNDIRWLFEYMTCSEYTVWFLMPSVFGNLEDISKITTDNINFDLMKTQIQLKQTNANAFDWTQAEKHVQELLLVAVQLAFGYHCQQNIIYLHSLNYLEKHQNFEFLNYSLIHSSDSKQLFFERNYFQRIFNVCAKLHICCVLEYCSSLCFYPSQAFIICGTWQEASQEWQFNVKDFDPKQEINSESVKSFLQQLKEHLK